MKISRNAIITAPAEGGELTVMEDKEVMARMFVPPGRHRASLWVDLVQPGQTIEASESLTIFPPPARTRLIVPDNHLDGGAVQDFQPTNTSRVAQRLDQALKRLDRLETVQEARRTARHNARKTAAQKEAEDAKAEKEADENATAEKAAADKAAAENEASKK